MPTFWQVTMFLAGLALNIGTYIALVMKNRSDEELRQKKNLLADGENAYKFECMWSDYKKYHRITAKNGDE